MAAYIVLTRETTTDQSEMDIYQSKVGPTFDGHDFKILVRYGAHEDVEGQPTEGTVILEFPSMQAAKAWYDGDAYRAVREHRFAGSKYHVIIVEGA